jgi:hypothetical protein
MIHVLHRLKRFAKAAASSELEILEPLEGVSRLFPGLPERDAISLQEEFFGNHDFFDSMERRMFEVRRRRIDWKAWNQFVYLVVRIAKPELLIETGVFDGQSSAVILEAMRCNGKGRLLSIDLPAVEMIEAATSKMPEKNLPPGHGAGWLIPDRLRTRHDLRLGDARKLLPELFSDGNSVDAFLHDSLHTYEHMEFEYRTAWPHIRQGGLLLSDDIAWVPAFQNFAKHLNRPYVVVGRPWLGKQAGCFGALTK